MLRAENIGIRVTYLVQCVAMVVFSTGNTTVVAFSVYCDTGSENASALSIFSSPKQIMTG